MAMKMAQNEARGDLDAQHDESENTYQYQHLPDLEVK